MSKTIKSILERNERVTQDKAWETSATRKLLIAVFTYVIIALFLKIIHVVNPFVNALVPTIGYLLSMLSLPIAKEMWVKRIYKK